MAIRTGILTVLAASLLVLTADAPVSAQGPRQAWSKGPTFSPYMQMFGRNTGPLNNYFDYVRPRQQLQAYVQQQDMRYQTLTTELQQTQYQIFPRTGPFQRQAIGAAPGQSGMGQPGGAPQAPLGAAGTATPLTLSAQGRVGMPSTAGYFQNQGQYFMGVNRGAGAPGAGRSGRGRQNLSIGR